MLAGAAGDEDVHAVLAIGLARMMALAALGRGDEIDASATSVAAIQDDVARQGNAHLRGSHDLKVVEATSFENGVVLLRYEIKR